MENHTDVNTPDGHVGKLCITRRERKLIDENKMFIVHVKGTDGIKREFNYIDLVEIIEEVPTFQCPYCNKELLE